MPNNGFPDLVRVDDLQQRALIRDGFRVLQAGPDGTPNEIGDWDGFKKAIDDAVVSIPDAMMTTKSKHGRTFHSILVELLPSLKVDNLDIDEERAYKYLLSQVSRRCSSGPT